MRALVTNDDGVRSPGLSLLADAAQRRGVDVLVVAPSYDASGSGASMTAVSSEGRVIVDSVAGTHALHGPPAFIVRSAVYGAFGPPPDVILSGVNRGLNVGRAVIHSGTVGAALTGGTYGCRSMAVSADVHDGEWDTITPVVEAAVGWLLDAPEAAVLNVNIPHFDGPSPPARATVLSERGTVQGNVTDTAGEMVPVTFDDGRLPAPGTDAAALAEGFVSVSAIRSVVDDDTFDLPELISRYRP
ncbi:MAG TPA: 5'/3'-nucleotidase SurE [Acidimicrobiales bacterium]|nr:5'/3'-nucleotidase SurE [Acidimicrobiales bacterium]